MESLHYGGHLAPVSSERTRLEPPTPMVKIALTPSHPNSSQPTQDKHLKARHSMPMPSPSPLTSMLGAVGVDTSTPTKKRRKSHHAGESSRKRDKHHRDWEGRTPHQNHPASSPIAARTPANGPPTSPMVGYTPLGMGNLSALASTALALAGAHPSEHEAIVNEEEAKRMEKARRREEKRKRREAREAAAAAEGGDDGGDGDNDDDAPKKKRKHKERDTPAKVTYSLPAPATPSRTADPVTPTPKRKKHLRDAGIKPETPYTGPSRSAADVSMTALLMSGRKKRPGLLGEEDEAVAKKRRSSRTGADMSVNALLMTPRPAGSGAPGTPMTADEKKALRRKEKKQKKDRKNRDRTVENTMGVHALLATPGAAAALPPSTPGYATDGDVPDTDGIEPADGDKRADKERRRAEKAARKAKRKEEKKAKKQREATAASATLTLAPPRLAAPDHTPLRQSRLSRSMVHSSILSDSDSDADSDDGVDPVTILRGMSRKPATLAPMAPPPLAAPAPPSVPAVPEIDLSNILRARPRTNTTPRKDAPALKDPPAPAPVPAAAATKAKRSQPKAVSIVPAVPSLPPPPRAPAHAVAAASTPAAFAAPSRGRKKNSTDAASQADQDARLRQELSNPDVMNEFLASKWIEIKELQRLEAAGVLRYKRGRFSEEERSALRDWLDVFRRSNLLSEEALLDIIMAKGKAGERSQYPKFYSDLAGQVPGRPVRYVKEAVKRMYDPRARKGAWTKKEDEELLRAYELHPNEWIKIAAIVDRSESDCRDRWRGELKGQESRVSGAWSTEETDSLIAAVTEANQRLGLPATAPDTPWQVVVDLMGGTRSLTQCRKKWQDTILPDLKAKEARDAGVNITKTSVSRRDLLDRLRALNVTHERDLSWTRVVPPEWDVKPGTLRGVWHRMKHGVEGWNEMPFTELLDRIEQSL